jgi:hypothetical protein
MSMDIYAESGSKVIFHNKAGYPFQITKAAKLLQVGEVYTVDHTIVHSDHTDVWLREYPDQRFNSVQFYDFLKDKAPASEEK